MEKGLVTSYIEKSLRSKTSPGPGCKRISKREVRAVRRSLDQYRIWSISALKECIWSVRMTHKWCMTKGQKVLEG